MGSGAPAGTSPTDVEKIKVLAPVDWVLSGSFLVCGAKSSLETHQGS